MTILVLGAAVSGRAAAALLHGLGEKVLVYDDDPAAGPDIVADEVRFGGWDPSLLERVDLVVSSPGIPPWAPPLRDAIESGVPVWSEIELAARHLEAPIGAVTATNGKTTVTEAAAAMLVASGRRAAAVGNIGEPLCGAVGESWDALVVEASSFQLRFVDRFHAVGAVLLNVAPDHLDWHGTFEAYIAAKQRILERQAPVDIVIYDADDPGAPAAVAGAAASRVPVSGSRLPEGGAGRDGAVLRIGEVAVPVGDLARSDDAFLVDLAAAGMLALHLGANDQGVGDAARSYTPGRHRREVIGEWAGVTWVNDSKATNPHAAIAAVRSYPWVVLVCGGRPKGLDAAAVAREPNIRHVIGMGEAGPEMVGAAKQGTLVASMEEAVDVARRIVRPGDTVLLAPGCASFDMFRSYAERGDEFVRAVRQSGGA
jgi:UDP-N-acetylmuramoylalanine--D-glutamate ligase